MPLTMGQMDELTKMLIQTDNIDGLPSNVLGVALNADIDVILTSINEMQKLTYKMFFIKQYKGSDIHDDFYMVKIPNNEKWKAELILKDGGWNKKFEDYFEMLRLEKEKEEHRKYLEEESWKATKEQAESANRISKRANLIAVISALIAFIALLLQLL